MKITLESLSKVIIDDKAYSPMVIDNPDAGSFWGICRVDSKEIRNHDFVKDIVMRYLTRDQIESFCLKWKINKQNISSLTSKETFIFPDHLDADNFIVAASCEMYIQNCCFELVVKREPGLCNTILRRLQHFCPDEQFKLVGRVSMFDDPGYDYLYRIPKANETATGTISPGYIDKAVKSSTPKTVEVKSIADSLADISKYIQTPVLTYTGMGIDDRGKEVVELKDNFGTMYRIDNEMGKMFIKASSQTTYQELPSAQSDCVYQTNTASNTAASAGRLTNIATNTIATTQAEVTWGVNTVTTTRPREDIQTLIEEEVNKRLSEMSLPKAAPLTITAYSYGETRSISFGGETFYFNSGFQSDKSKLDRLFKCIETVGGKKETFDEILKLKDGYNIVPSSTDLHVILFYTVLAFLCRYSYVKITLCMFSNKNIQILKRAYEEMFSTNEMNTYLNLWQSDYASGTWIAYDRRLVLADFSEECHKSDVDSENSQIEIDEPPTINVRTKSKKNKMKFEFD